MTSTIIICLLISAVIAYFVMIDPLFLKPAAGYYSTDNENLEFDQSIALLETISELEADYKMGKLSEADYEALSLEYKRSYLALKKVL